MSQKKDFSTALEELVGELNRFCKKFSIQLYPGEELGACKKILTAPNEKARAWWGRSQRTVLSFK